jgi:hypothetical protein
MDAKLEWVIDPEVEGLVNAVLQCRQQLVTQCVLKHGMKAHLVSTEAYAGDKVLELFQQSVRWLPCMEMTEEDLSVPAHRRQKKTTELVADFASFKLHRMSVLGETDVRVVVTMDVGDIAEQVMFGNIALVPR